MARLVDYEAVLKTLLGQGLKSLYYNSGSFGFPPGTTTHTIGWIGPPDSTIRPEALALIRQAAEPYDTNLSRLTLEVWRDLVPGLVWALPRSHWAYELDFGSRDWMPEALREVGIDPEALATLNTGAGIEFHAGHPDEFDGFLVRLLNNLSGSSDFQLVWPGRPLLCTVHHHKQLWWTTSDEALYRRIERLA